MEPSKYKKLNEIPIPKRGLILSSIVGDLHYIVWEENLLKPQVFKYAFADDYHARKFGERFLSGFRYNVLPGEILLQYGIEISNQRLTKLTKKNSGVVPLKYAIHPDLPFERKKTLRTLYRRNQRRLLLKLLNMKLKPKNG